MEDNQISQNPTLDASENVEMTLEQQSPLKPYKLLEPHSSRVLYCFI